jgi:hypothetical protein
MAIPLESPLERRASVRLGLLSKVANRGGRTLAVVMDNDAPGGSSS